MPLLRATPKNLGTMVAMAFLGLSFLFLGGVFYFNNFLDSNYIDSDWVQDNIGYITNLEFIYGPNSDDRRQIHRDDPVFNSMAYQKQLELDQLDEEEEELAPPAENEDIKPFEVLSYKESLKRTADQYGSVMIKFCEDGRVDNAINFHETSIVSNEISNILYISPDTRVCRELWKLEIKCHVMEDEFMTFNNTRFDDDPLHVGKKRAIARLKLILKAITAGYTILFTDLTTLYMKNPFDYVDCNDHCDAAISVDNISMNYANWAVHLAKPRRTTVYMYARILTILGSMPSASSKDILNRVVTEMVSKKQISVEFLDPEKFSPASLFFQARRFADDKTRCRTCVAIFEDRGISKHDQIYQLKEIHLWQANFDEYYTSRQRTYIVYHNPFDFAERRSLIEEFTALRNALAIGQILDRIVILPKFHCPDSIFESKYCGLGDLLKISEFDEQFGDRYRESTFLYNPKVSREVRRTVTDPYFIGNKLPDEDWDPEAGIRPKAKYIYIKPQHSKGMTADEIEDTFRTETSYNLLFHSLYEGFAGFEDRADAMDFDRKIKLAFALISPVRTIIGDKSFAMLG